ncbi:MAG: type II secretion system protein [Clostridiaceae bacterium]|nr:type II secretion system protein [Clostridiaceae bacterium]
MKNGQRGFTLAEMIMAIAMLAFFSVFVVQMFAKANQLTIKASTLDQAVACASDLADQWKRQPAADVPEVLLNLRTNRSAGRTETLGFDADFHLCAMQEAVYTAVLVLQPEEPSGLWQLQITLYGDEKADGNPIYALTTDCYFAKEKTDS